MKNFEIYNEGLIANGEISKVFLQEEMDDYEEKVKDTATQILAETDLKGDAFVDEFFNRLDEQSLLTFQNENVTYLLSISRSYKAIEDEVQDQSAENFGASYVIEHRDADANLLDISDFSSGEEDKLIEVIQGLGLNLNEITN